MKISKLYTYPIKSLRPHCSESAVVTKHGFQYDRRFMLLQVVQDDDKQVSYKNMHVTHYPEMVLFFTALQLPSAPNARDGIINVTFKPSDGGQDSLEVPLEPATGDLEVVDVVMHRSPTKAYKMHDTYNKWFSDCFGYQVILAYLGENLRNVLMSSPLGTNLQTPSKGWLSSFTSMATSVLGGEADKDDQGITFADCAPYLVVSERSMDDVHNRLPAGQLMDLTKFRPSIVISGAEEPWEEDWWAKLTVGHSTKIECIHNCVRCKSINIDYATGKPGTTEAGKMLAKLQKDRRVDPGAKYSPVFGRYSFLHADNDGDVIKVGDEVVVITKNAERTRFDWPGLGTS